MKNYTEMNDYEKIKFSIECDTSWHNNMAYFATNEITYTFIKDDEEQTMSVFWHKTGQTDKNRAEIDIETYGQYLAVRDFIELFSKKD